MKVLLAALNSKFIHSNLAVRYLKAYTQKLNYNCTIKEFTINDRREKVLEEIIGEKPDVVAFSCYIWNIEYIKSLAVLIKLINPKVEILYGGPEVSYDSDSFLKSVPGEYVIVGEGEETYYQFVKLRKKYFDTSGKVNNKEFFLELRDIKGLCFKQNENVILNEQREPMDMNKIVFPYTKEDNLKNKIVYYEASRGCPFKCKYCLSSASFEVRFLNIERVKKELKFLMDKDIKLIKFVDRTFNCNYEFAMEIWKFVINADTDVTFHFEISADVLKDEEIKLLNTAPKGRIQLEVGVQTTNDTVLNNINRYVKFNYIYDRVKKVQKYHNINQHLDLIAGLPGEDFESFKKSFNDVYSIKPEALQLGFLKLLKGSSMIEEVSKWGMVYSPYAPYEILKTDSISYDEIVILKRIEEVFDKYYNSGKFKNILNYFVPKFKTAFDFYYELGKFFYNKGYLNKNISSSDYYKVFIEFENECLNEKNIELEEIIKYDYLKFNKKKWLPDFLMREKNKEEEKTIKAKIEDGFIEVSKKYHIEKFFINIERLLNDSVLEKKEGYVIFDIENDKEIYLFHE
ncbi:B12-binding domain-containing radical SAM protein [Clostridium autoethanogenum]|uniref:B12-binding domain-containing radical SAM protein n=1 Tax=Clostridium autoethanogenum TaxID=84023 RepID=UPI00041886E9|nr:B12-binding domain-containing radical SAM protein [Clostridium autoethanogenum]ALU34716.1 Radical SAM protein [Clostridium autoethanogenum DSM 10061]OVY51435.1 coproporphyrinogen III oxidase [Clostridium autoethanogenum]